MTAPLTFTANLIITDALQKLGIYAPAEQVSDADMARGLVVLNDMLDQWQNESVFIYSLTTTALNLQATAASYTIGPPGTMANIATGRPNKIQQGPGAASVLAAGTTYNVNVISALEWSCIQSIAPASGIPDTLFYDPQYPVGVLNVSPTPNAAMVLTFYQLIAFTSFATSATSAAFAQGTVDALKNNLAVNLKPYFSSAQLDPVIVARSETSKEFLRTQSVVSRAMLKRAVSPVAKPSSKPPGSP